MRLIAAPHPFKTTQIDRYIPAGPTLAEMLELSGIDPVLAEHGHIWIGDQYVHRHLWHRVRPKEGATITLRVVPHGGGGGGKNILRVVLTIAVLAAAVYFGPALGASLAGFSSVSAATAAGATIAGLGFGTFGTALIALGGTLLVNLIAPVRPPSLDGLSGGNRQSPTLFIEGSRNTPRPFSVVPSVLGGHRTVPPLGATTYTEVVGDDIYLRMLAVWGYGPLKIEDVKIGETPIANFDGVTIQHREGRAGDAAITLVPDVVFQEDLNILLQQVDGFTTLQTQPDADEISIDITFPAGLVKFRSSNGSASNWSVTMQVQYREVGSGTWLTPTFTDKTVPNSWVSGSSVTFTHRRQAAIRHGFRWSVASRGQYEVRVRRTTTDANTTTNDTVVQEFYWTALRTITDEDPLNFAFPVAATALRIKATDQLNGVVDELNAVISSYVTSYVGGSPAWAEAVSSNPADLFRHVLQGPANARPLPDARVDIEKLQDWHTFCAANGFEFNMVRDFTASVWDTLADIAAAGRASPTQIDGKWSVVYDYEQSVPVQHFTPRNSWGFEAEKAFPDQPHAFRIRFPNREKDWRQDERIVYADGFSSANAEDFEGLDAIGITDPEHVWKFGRFSLAQITNRPERWNLFTDFEYIVARRGDLVAVTHDVLLVGLATGRIKSIQTDGSSPPSVTGFTSDEVLTMEAGKDYGVAIRTVSGELTRQIVTSAGDQTTVTFTDPIPNGSTAPSVGDLFGFGTLGSETIEGLMLAIEPLSELTARLTIIPASPEVYDADQGVIPPFDSKLTTLPVVPDVDITNVRSDETILEFGAGNTLVPHIGVSVVIPDSPLRLVADVQIRATGTDEPFYAATVVSRVGSEITIGDVQEGAEYDLRLRWRTEDRAVPGNWSTVIGHRVVGQSSAPSALQNATISVHGNAALIRWSRPPEIDVRLGGQVKFRHSPETDPSLALWQSSTSIGQAAKGDALFASLPLKPGTYLARVFDKGGRSSPAVTLATKQASVLAYANVDTVTESPGFPGNKTNVVESDGSLWLAGVGQFDDIADFDAVGNLDAFGGIQASGTYDFAGGFDFGTVKRVRLTSSIDATSVNTLDKIDERTEEIDTWEDFDGTSQSAADARVQVRTTDDDPSASPVNWSAWNDLDSGEFEARGCDFRVLLSTTDEAFNIRVDALGVVAEEV